MTITNLSGGHCCVCAGICHHVGPARYCAEHKPTATRQAPVVVPMPGKLLRPCPASVAAVLGFDEPVTVPCGLAAGHKGKHRYLIEWTDESAASSTTPKATARHRTEPRK